MEIEKPKKGQTPNRNSVMGPNINPNPSSIYNFKK